MLLDPRNKCFALIASATRVKLLKLELLGQVYSNTECLCYRETHICAARNLTTRITVVIPELSAILVLPTLVLPDTLSELTVHTLYSL